VGTGLRATKVEPEHTEVLVVTVTVYTPAVEELQLGIETVGPDAEKLFGPVHAYDTAPIAPVALNTIVAPGQYGPVFDAVTEHVGKHERLPPPADSIICTMPWHPPVLVKSKI
jgi:hypothetical protein